MCTYCAQDNLQEFGSLWIIRHLPTEIKTTADEHRLCPPPVDNDCLLEAVVQH